MTIAKIVYILRSFLYILESFLKFKVMNGKIFGGMINLKYFEECLIFMFFGGGMGEGK